MSTKLKVILAAMSATALLASPVTAKTVRKHQAAPPTTNSEAAPRTTNVPSDARGSAVPAASSATTLPANEGGPYTPSKQMPYQGKNPDFHAAK